MHAIRYAETATELAAATLLQRQFKLETYVDCNSLTMHMQQWLRLSDMLIGKLIGRTRHKIVHAQNESVASVCCFACSGSAPCTAWQMHTKTCTAQHSTAQHSRHQACLASFIYHDMCELQGPQTGGAVPRCPFTSPLIEGSIVSFPQHACNTLLVTSHSTSMVCQVRT